MSDGVVTVAGVGETVDVGGEDLLVRAAMG